LEDTALRLPDIARIRIGYEAVSSDGSGSP
jgi:hypothetical protein